MSLGPPTRARVLRLASLSPAKHRKAEDGPMAHPSHGSVVALGVGKPSRKPEAVFLFFVFFFGGEGISWKRDTHL